MRREKTNRRKAPYPTSRASSGGGGGGGADSAAAAPWSNDLYQAPALPLTLGGPTHAQIQKVLSALLSSFPSSSSPLPLPPLVVAAFAPLILVLPSAPSPPPSQVVGDTLAISNLHREVNADDLRAIFSPLGPIRHCAVHYSQDGRSLGTASVTYRRAEDAERAADEFDGAEVDGREMRIKLVGQVVTQPLVLHGGAAAPPAFNPLLMPMLAAGAATGDGGQGGRLGRGQDGRRGRGGREGGQQGRGERRERGKQTQAGGGGSEGGRGGGRGKAGGGRGGRKERAPVKAEDLDAEMDSYQTARQGSATEVKEEKAAAPTDS